MIFLLLLKKIGQARAPALTDIDLTPLKLKEQRSDQIDFNAFEKFSKETSKILLHALLRIYRTRQLSNCCTIVG